MAEHMDGPFPAVSEALRALDRGSENVGCLKFDRQRDHRFRQRDCATDSHECAGIEPEQEGWRESRDCWPKGKAHSVRNSMLSISLPIYEPVGIAQLTREQEKEEEIWLVADGSDLCKPYAETMPYLMQVRGRARKAGARV